MSSRRVRSWVVVAALLTLFCNAPAGAVALFFAIRAGTLESAGNEDEAAKMTQFAMLACLLTVPFGLFVGCTGYGAQSLLGW